MAKKGVVIFDGEDMFINPKKAIYSKTRGEARNVSFVSARGDDGPEEPEGPAGRERIVRDEPSGGGGASPITQPTPIVTEPQPTVIQQSESLSKQKGVEPDTPITVTLPKAEVPTIVVPPILPPDYIAPTPETPKRPTPPGRTDPVSGIRYKGDEPEPGATPIYTIDDGTPQKPVIDTPRYVAPTPVLPTAPVPPPAIVIPDPMGGGGSPLLGKDPEIPKIDCPDGFMLNRITGSCVPILGTGDGLGGTKQPNPSPIDPCAFPPTIPLIANHEWKKTGDCTWEQIPIPSTSTTDTTTTKSTSTIDTTTTKSTNTDPCAGVPKPQLAAPPTGQKWQRKADCSYELVDDGTGAADKVEETTTTTSSTTTTTTKKSKNCNPPIYAAPKYYKWVDKGNCTFELAVDNTQIKDAAPAPVLPAAAGQPIININLPQGGLGTLPTTPTTPTTPEPMPSGGDSGGGGGGGGTPFPEEPAPVVEEAPKKNYFWWYVGGALAVYLLIKRKKSQ